MYTSIQKAIYKMKKKKGASTIEIVIGMFIFLIAFCFLMDLLMLLWKFSVIAQTTTQVARISGIQGGAGTSPPGSWYGGASNYTNVAQMHNLVEEKFASAGIDSTEWEMQIGSGRIGSGGTASTGNIDYKTNFEVVATVKYHWDYVSNILPLVDLNQTITAKRPAMSEWKFDYNDWVGE